MRRHKILVVDDEVPNLRLLRRVLSEEHDIFEAQSGKEGLDLLGSETISLVITDQRMPNMTGVQLLEQSLAILDKNNLGNSAKAAAILWNLVLTCRDLDDNSASEQYKLRAQAIDKSFNRICREP